MCIAFKYIYLGFAIVLFKKTDCCALSHTDTGCLAMFGQQNGLWQKAKIMSRIE